MHPGGPSTQSCGIPHRPSGQWRLWPRPVPGSQAPRLSPVGAVGNPGADRARILVESAARWLGLSVCQRPAWTGRHARRSDNWLRERGYNSRGYRDAHRSNCRREPLGTNSIYCHHHILVIHRCVHKPAAGTSTTSFSKHRRFLAPASYPPVSRSPTLLARRRGQPQHCQQWSSLLALSERGRSPRGLVALGLDLGGRSLAPPQAVRSVRGLRCEPSLSRPQPSAHCAVGLKGMPRASISEAFELDFGSSGSARTSSPATS